MDAPRALPANNSRYTLPPEIATFFHYPRTPPPPPVTDETDNKALRPAYPRTVSSSAEVFSVLLRHLTVFFSSYFPHARSRGSRHCAWFFLSRCSPEQTPLYVYRHCPSSAAIAYNRITHYIADLVIVSSRIIDTHTRTHRSTTRSLPFSLIQDSRYGMQSRQFHPQVTPNPAIFSPFFCSIGRRLVQIIPFHIRNV